MFVRQWVPVLLVLAFAASLFVVALPVRAGIGLPSTPIVFNTITAWRDSITLTYTYYDSAALPCATPVLLMDQVAFTVHEADASALVGSLTDTAPTCGVARTLTFALNSALVSEGEILLITAVGHIPLGIALLPQMATTTANGLAPIAPLAQFFAGYRDGRINYREVYAPVALYAIDNGTNGFGLNIYHIGPNGGTLALAVEPQAFAGVPEPLRAPYLVAATPDGFIQVYKLPDGKYQVIVGPDEEGKITVIVFDRLCSGFACTPYTTFQH